LDCRDNFAENVTLEKEVPLDSGSNLDTDSWSTIRNKTRTVFADPNALVSANAI